MKKSHPSPQASRINYQFPGDAEEWAAVKSTSQGYNQQRQTMRNWSKRTSSLNKQIAKENNNNKKMNEKPMD